MAKYNKKKILTVLAIVLAVGGLVFLFLYITNPSLFSRNTVNGDSDGLEWNENVVNNPNQNNAQGGQAAFTKYLWEFGWQNVAEEQPSQVTATTLPTTTAVMPSTYYEAVTDWKGGLVTDRYGQPVTKVKEFYTDLQYYAMTDSGGNVARDEYGGYMMGVQTVEVTRTTQPPPLTMQDGHGNIVTKKNGQPVTKIAKPTVYVTNPETVGAVYQGEGISDGENYIGVRVIIDGVYDIATNGAMTLGMTYKIDKKVHLKSLTYNIDQGTCRVSKDENYTGMVTLSKENNKMVITLSIPDAAQIPVSQMRLLSASSLFGTFRDSTGTYVDGFTVNVL